jgi:hypothetical protein
MKTLEADAVVDAEGLLRLELPTNLPPGRLHVTLVVADSAAPADDKAALQLTVIRGGDIPASFSTRRDDIYGDNGR